MFHNLLVVLLILSSGLFLNSPQAQSYPIKSGIIEYVLTGRSYGTENISFDKYGKLIIVSKTLSFLVDGEVRNENLIVIIKNDSIFEFNSKLKTYTISSVFENSYNASNHLVNQELLLAMGFFHTGKEIVAKHEQ